MRKIGYDNIIGEPAAIEGGRVDAQAWERGKDVQQTTGETGSGRRITER
jgi:hypothetical protein